jgi:hypothetical protein
MALAEVEVRPRVEEGVLREGGNRHGRPHVVVVVVGGTRALPESCPPRVCLEPGEMLF